MKYSNSNSERIIIKKKMKWNGYIDILCKWGNPDFMTLWKTVSWLSYNEFAKKNSNKFVKNV